MIPKKIEPYFKMDFQKKDKDSIFTKGRLTCCNYSNFEITFIGEIQQGLFGKMFVYPQDDQIVIAARCKKCGQVISVFDSKCDGYDFDENQRYIQVYPKEFNCKKCSKNDFSVEINYEYPNEQELKEDGLSEIDNAFSWIWVTLKCNNCMKKYKKIVDCETA